MTRPRGRAHVPLRTLARLTGYSPAYLCRLLNGHRRPSVECLTRLADAFGTSPDQVLRWLQLWHETPDPSRESGNPGAR
jgi:transcriptional regulator with XRE-family HTH domain